MTDNAQAWTVYNSLMVDPLTHTVYSAGEEVHLPEMEYQLLYYFLQHPGQTLSRKTLMLAVWGAPPGLKTRTLDIHICQLRKKLKLGSSLQTVFKVGYKLRLPTNRNEGERCNPLKQKRKVKRSIVFSGSFPQSSVLLVVSLESFRLSRLLR